jgi:hypothetical protein
MSIKIRARVEAITLINADNYESSSTACNAIHKAVKDALDAIGSATSVDVTLNLAAEK